MRATKGIAVVIAVAVMSLAIGIQAGSLDPSAAPAPTMHTLEEIYQELVSQRDRLADFEALLASSTPSDMSVVPAATVVMGDTFGEGNADELPLHTNTMLTFYMDSTEVTKSEWDAVASWAITNGYDITTSGGLGKASDHPVRNVTWYESVKYCNAKSEMEGLVPCYVVVTNSAVMRTGTGDPTCDWYASGYRLPTEAEWEMAARGGVTGTRFPWTAVATIQHARANYLSTNAVSYDTSPTAGYHPTYATGGIPYTNPGGVFLPNRYGLYDMAGNIYEWCWDWYDMNYYTNGPATGPTGPASGTARVMRGGSWDETAFAARVSARNSQVPGNGLSTLGFRTVRVVP